MHCCGQMSTKRYSLESRRRARFEKLITSVVKTVKPTDKEIEVATSTVNYLMAKIRRVAPKNVEILLAGSVARGTQIIGNSDVDIFLLFPRKTKVEEVERRGLEIGKRIVNRKKNESYVIKYAEHPYVKVYLSDLGINADIVPAYKISSADQRGTSVDRTQLHNEFVNTNLTERQRDDVRALKSFLRSHWIYGAEARTEGFSGYLCELLVYRYGSFLGVIEAMANLTLPVIVDVIGRGFVEPNSDEGKRMLKQFKSEFIVLDPTDRDRNVSAVVSMDSLARLTIISRKLLKRPDKEIFYGEGYSDIGARGKLTKIRKDMGVSVYAMTAKLPDISEDITWQQLRRLRHRLTNMLKEEGFEPYISLQEVKGTTAVMAFFVGRPRVHATVTYGPEVTMGAATERFMDAHKRAYFTSIYDGRVMTIDAVKHETPEELLMRAIKGNRVALPSYIRRRGMKMYVNTMPNEVASMLYRAYEKKALI